MPDLIDWLVEHEPAFSKSRLPSLYSDLSVQKSTNPEGYAANVSAWQSALARAAVAGQFPGDRRLTIQTSDELLDALASARYGRPSGLGLVLDEGIKNGKMLSLNDFRNAEQTIYHRTWVPSPWTVLKWGLKQAGLAGDSSYDESGRLRPGQLVIVSALEDLCKQIQIAEIKRGTALTDRVMTREAFGTELARLNTEILSPQDLDILLRYLQRDKGILTYDSKIVKFKPTTSEVPEPITTEDTTIANLKSLVASLESQIANLNVRILTLQSNAKSAVQAKNKAAALSALRSKKLAEATLQQRTDTLARLEEVYAKIEEAVDQVQIVTVMQNSVAVLRSLNKKIGGVEKVEDVVEELREEMSQVDEVGQVLQEPLDGKTVLDEAEVDDELEEMEKEERRKEEDRAAEETRKQLATLEQARQREPAYSERQSESEYQQTLRNSIEHLDGMKITEESTPADHQGKLKLEKRVEVPEHAS